VLAWTIATAALAWAAPKAPRHRPDSPKWHRIRLFRDEFLRSEARDQPSTAVGGATATAALAGVAADTAPSGCVRQVCSLAGLTCLSDDQVLRVARVCSGNLSGDCVRVACANLGAIRCNDADQVFEIVRACRVDFSGDCLAAACRLVGQATCSDRGSVLSLIAACAGNYSGGCVTSVCNRLGSPSCDTVAEVSRVAVACGTGS